jgi:PPOX class probable F420-dependent enzyme
MDPDQARDFIGRNSRSVLATFRRDGGVQMSPVTAVVDGEGVAVISSRETAIKVRNLRRDPRGFLCVLSDRFYGPWVFVEGTAHIVSLPDAMDGLVDYYRRAAGDHPDWEDYRRAMVTERRVLIRLPIERAGPTVSG